MRPEDPGLPIDLRLLGKGSDAEVIAPMLQEEDRHQEWMHNNYKWYLWLGWERKARRVLEVGVYKGYSAYAMLAMCRAPQYIGFDNASYGIKPAEIQERLRAAFGDRPHGIRAIERDTQKMTAGELSVWTPTQAFDMAHVDGDHSYQGALHDLQLVTPYMAIGSVILIDDVLSNEDVMQAVRDFTAHFEMAWLVYPKHNGLAVIFL